MAIIMSMEEWDRKRKNKSVSVGSAALASSVKDSSATESKRRVLPSLETWESSQSYDTSLKGFAKQADTTVRAIQKYYSEYHDDEDKWYDSYDQSLSTLLSSADRYRREYADDADVVASIDEIADTLTKTKTYIKEANKRNKRWKGTESYTKTMNRLAEADKINELYGMSSQEIESAQLEAQGIGTEELEALQAKKKSLEQKANAYSFSRGVTLEQKKAVQNELAQVNNAIQSAEQKSAIAYTTMDGQNITWDALYRRKKKEEDYASFSKRDDWAENSTYKSTIPDENADYNDFSLPTVDWDYEEMNNPEAFSHLRGSSTYRSEHMTKEEMEMFNYLYHTQGRDAAFDWQRGLAEDLETLRVQDITAKTKEFASKSPLHGAAAWVGARLTSPLAGVEYVGDLVDNLFVPEKSMRNTVAARNTAVDSAITEQVDWNIGKWDAFDFGYGTLASAVDSALASLLPGGEAVLGLSAAAAATNAALDRGMDERGAIKAGISAGVFESVFEHISIGQFRNLQMIDPKSAKDFLLNTIKSMGVNASEEAATEIANSVYDIYVNGEFSDYETNVRMMVQSGMTPEEARAEAKKALGKQIAEAAASGALMGFGFGAVGSVGGYMNNASKAKALYGSDPSALVNEALEIDPNNALAQKMQGRLDAGKNVSGGQLANLAQQNEQAIRAGDTEKIHQAVTNRLTELGETENVETVANVLTKQAVGETLTRAEQELIRRNKYAQRVAHELNPENIRSGGYTNEWAQKIDTDRINVEEYSRLVEAAQLETEGTAERGSIEKTGDFLNEDEENATRKENLQAEEKAHIPYEKTAGMGHFEGEVAENDPEKLNSSERAAVAATEESSAAEKATVTLEEASKKYGAQAGAMVSTYNIGGGKQDIAKFDTAYQMAYDMGKSGVSLDYAMNSETTAYLSEKQREFAHVAGEAAANSEATAKDAANRAAANGKTGRKRGAVKGEGVSIKDLKETFNDPQGRAYSYLSQVAEVTGIDIVLYRSKAGADGKFKGAQGKYDGVKKPGTIYIDINAGLSGVDDVKKLHRYAMLRTFSHEFTHFIERWNPVQYNEFRKVVFEEITKRGENVHDLIELKMDGGKLSYDKASREVVAEAMTDILPDSTFVETLATKHKTLFNKLLEKLHEFIDNLKAYFKTIGGSYDRGAIALKEQVGDTLKYLNGIVDMFDTIAVQAVENYQQTVAVDEVVSTTETTTVSEATSEATSEVTTSAEKIDTVVEEKTEKDSQIAEKPAESVTETSPHGFTISDNAEYGSLEIKFDEKPSDEVRHVLKENKFKWHKVKKVWFGFADRKTITDALNSAYEVAETVAETEAEVAAENQREDSMVPATPAIKAKAEEAEQIYGSDTLATIPLMDRQYAVQHKSDGTYTVSVIGKGSGFVPNDMFKDGFHSFAEASEYAIRWILANDQEFKIKWRKTYAELTGITAAKVPVEETVAETTTVEETAPAAEAADDPYSELEKAMGNLSRFEYRGFVWHVIKDVLDSSKWQGRIDEADVSVNGIYVSNARGIHYRSKLYDNRDDARDDILAVARNNKLLDERTDTTNNVEEEVNNGKESENGSDTGTVPEPVRGSEEASRLLEGVEPEAVRAGDERRGSVRAGSDEGTGDAGRDRRADAAGPVSERSPRDSVGGNLQQLSGVTEEPGILTSHAAAKEYAESKGYRIEINKLSAQKNVVQVDIYDKQGLPTFNPVIIGELGKDSDPSAWNKVKEAIDKREAESVTETAADTNVGSKMTEEEAEQLHEEVQQEVSKKSTPTPKGSNFVIGDSLNLPSGTKARTRANIDAIKLVKKIAAEDRIATPAEQEILSKYVGWGGLPDAFGKPFTNHATRKIEYEAVKGLETEFEELKSVLTEEEYKAARESTKNAHYTSVEVIKAMYDGLKQLGFTGGRMLEPSSGVGNFVGAMPADMSSQVKSWTMVELDNITGMLAKYLYPNADVRIQGFEETNIPDGYMDVAIGNVPFGNYAIADKHYPKAVTDAIHNYFFAKALDKVRPGGVVMFITSSYTMNGRDSAVRKYMMQRADLMGAIRLPNTAFSGNAGTSVVTDILVLKKREARTEYSGEAFTESNWERMSKVGWEGAYVNEYFVKHPEMVLGTAKLARGMYSANELTVDPFTDRGTLGDQIREAFKNIKGKMEYSAQATAEQENIRQASVKRKSQKLQVKNGVIQAKDENGNVYKVDVDKDTADRITGMVAIRDAHTALCDALQQGAEKKTITSLRKTLNKAYDAFVEKYGYLNAAKNRKAINQFADRYAILSLENYSQKENASGKGKKTEVVTKSDIFTKDTIAANRTAASAENVEEGLTISLNTAGTVDVSMIARLTGQKVESVTRQLIDQRLVFKDKNGKLIPAVQYLSGNVRAKLREMEGLVGMDADYRNNVEALHEVVPPTVEYTDIYVNPGATWVPVSVYEDFVSHILNRRNHESYRTGKKDFSVEYVPETNEYKVSINDEYAKRSAQNTQVWGESGKAFSTIYENMLNGRRTNVYKDGPDGKRVLDKVRTEAVAEKVEKLNEEFRKWMWEDEARRGEMQELYNESYNALVTPKYSGSTLTVNGLNSSYTLRDHQKDAVARIINSGGNTLLAHRVGAGKTMEMAAAAMKLKQLGVIKKPMFVVPNNVVAQWGNEFKDYFPAANILLVGDEDMTPAERMTTINKIKNNDYDAVILAYTKFEKIQMTKAWRQKFYEEQIDSIIYAINAEKEAEKKGKGFTVKQLEAKRKQLETKLKKLTDKAKDEDGAMFEDLGVDSLFVDEAHNFKNLEYTTRMSNVSGLSKPEGAQRSFDLYTKIRYLQQLNGGRGVVFATATPVMNSMTEMYIMQKYLQPDTLKQLGIDNFDSWAKMFGEVVNALEIAPSGSGYRLKQTFSKFKNVKALQQLFRSFTDVLTDVPGLKIPKMKGGKVQIVECEQGEFQKNYMAELANRAENVKNVDPTEDNMLKITSDGRKISYSQRMIDPSLPYEETGKIYKCCTNVYNVYKESSKTKGTQMIFCDMATPKGKANTGAADTEADEFDSVDVESAQLYDDIKSRLVQMGIPAKEIAFIHDAKNDKQKAALSEKMNNGTIRVLLGSTGKMGVGLNAQKKAIAIHHLDAPWRPGDIEQRDGRVFRQKNENEEAYKFVYVTKGSFDSRLWDILERKQKFINQVMNGDDVGNEIEDTGEVTLSAAEVKAVASDNPLIMEQVALEKEISKLQSLQQAHRANVTKAEEKIGLDRRAIAALETRIENVETDIQNRKDTYSDDKLFSIQVGNQTYTDKKDAGVALMAAAQAKAVQGSYTAIGKFAGLTLRVVKTPEGIKGVVAGAGNYDFKTYPLNTTHGINHLIGVVEGMDNNLKLWNKQLLEAKSDLETQKKIAAEPFEQAEKLKEKRSRYNEIMYILNPPVEQNVSEDTVQEQSRSYLSDDAENFQNDIDAWNRDGRPAGETFILGSTGEVLQGLGAIESDIYMQSDKINTILEKHPEMTLQEIKKIPQILENPILVLKSRNVGRGASQNTRVVMFGTVKAQNGQPVLTVLDLRPTEKHLVIDDMQKVTSAYTKDRGPIPFLQNSEALYVDNEKSTKLLRTIGFQMPIELHQSGFTGSISYEGQNVNISGVPFNEILTEESEQYQQRTNSLTDREVLELAADNVNTAQFTDAERDALNIFKKRLAKLQNLEEQRSEQGHLYKEQQFGTNVNREEAAKTLNRMHLLDDQIRAANDDVFDVEEKAVLRQVLQKARKVVEQQEREHGQELLKRYRDRRNNAAAIKKYRERLRGDVDELTSWILHPDNKNVVKHVPDALKDSVIPFLSSINFMSKRQLSGGKATAADKAFKEQLSKLAKVMGKTVGLDDMYANYNDLPPDFMDNMRNFQEVVQQIIDNSNGDFVINQMTSEELKDLSKIVRTLKKYIMQMNNFHVNAMFQHVYEAGDNSIDFLSAMKPAKNTGALSNFTLWQQMRPAYAFERFGKGGEAIYDGLRRGQATLAFNTKKIEAFSRKAYTAAEVNAWEKQVKTIQLGAGRVVKMKVSQIMSLYELNKREQARKHIFGEGIRVATFKDGKTKISDVGQSLTPAELKIILKQLTPRQIEVADTLQQYMQKQGGEWGNYVTLARFGEKLFGEKDYYPINSDGRHLQVDADEGLKNAPLYALLNMGFTKQTQENAKNRLIVYSIFDVFSNHMASMAQYNAFALPVIDALKWFNYQQVDIGSDGTKTLLGSVREEMDRVYGVPEETRPDSGKKGYAQNFIINIIKAFNGTEAQGVPEDAFAVGGLHKFNVAKVAFNLRVVVQQPLAITRAALLVDYRSIIKGMNPAEAKKNIAEMREHSGIAAWKELGFYDVNISRGLTSLIKHDETGMDKVIDFGMKGAETADTLTWAGIWGACKAEVIRKQKLTPKDKGFYEAVTKLFEDVIYKTQVVDSVLTKNQWMRSKGFWARTTSSFMSEPVTTASMLMDAFDKYQMDMQRGMTRQQAWNKNRRMIGRVAYVYGVGAVLLAAVQAAADALRDDDEYETMLEKFVEAFKDNLINELNPLAKLPIVSDLFDAVKLALNYFGVEEIFGVDIYGYEPNMIYMNWLKALEKAGKGWQAIAEGKEGYTKYYVVYNLLDAASGIVGLPMAAATREIITAWNNTVGTMAPSLKVKSYDPGDKNEIKYAYLEGYLTDEEAKEELLSKGLVDTADEAYWLVQGWEAGEGYSRYDAIYDAVRNGGDYNRAMRELTSHGYSEKDVLSNVKGEIGKWYRSGEITKQQATSMLTKYIDMDSDEVTSTVNKWSTVVVTGMEYDDIKDEYLARNITASRAIEMYVRYGGYSKEDATGKVKVFDWQNDGYDIESASAIQDYETFCKPVGIDRGTYFDVWTFYNNTESDKDQDGNPIANSVTVKVMPYINSLPLTAEQKTALAKCWWADKTIEKYKLW